jgi:SAM-dependent methyltransferase
VDQLETAAAVWAMADYRRVAERLMPAAERLAATLGVGRGRQAIDVAAGTGNVAVCLQEQGWSVYATDVSARMVELGRARTGSAVRWDVAAAEALPSPDESVNAVVSSFGLIFAVGVDEALQEIQRVLRPGGTLAFTAWTADGYMAAMTEVMLAHLPTAVGPSPIAWGDPAIATVRLHRFADVSVRRWSLPWHFDSPAAGRLFYEQGSPAHAAAMAALEGPQATAMMDSVERHLQTLADADGQVRIDAEYLLITAVAARPEGSGDEG